MKISGRTLLIVGFFFLGGCYQVVNHGDGECVEYKPFCVKGCEYCIVDDKGCEYCSCEHDCPDDAGWPPRMQERN